ncbi:MAG: DNA mismatch repair protein MutS, partial [Clostridia bacterium]|nr:DNA mismatch repair protein MutS [Clostridia bacterium]
MLDEATNNYIMSLYTDGKVYAYAYSDITTGLFKAGIVDTLGQIDDQIARLCPSEILCNEMVYAEHKNLSCAISGDNVEIKKYYEWAYQTNNASKIIEEHYHLASIKGFDFCQDTNLISVIGSLLQYLKDTQKRTISNLAIPSVEYAKDILYIDSNTRRNLELEENSRNREKKGSLLWVLDDTKTSMGKRKLKSWLRTPLQDVKAITARQDKIESLINVPIIRQSLDIELDALVDIERLVGRINYGSVGPKDCLALAESLEHMPNIKATLQVLPVFNDMCEQLSDVQEVVAYIRKMINKDTPTFVSDGGAINDGVDENLDRYRSMTSNAKEYIEKLEARERYETGIKNLKVAYNRVYGYYIEVNKQYTSLVPYGYIHKQTVANNERYVTEELKKYEEELLTSDDKALKLEQAIYQQVKEHLAQYTVVLLKIANILAEIDCFNSLAKVAYANDYIRPVVDNSRQINIVSGRHPVVEQSIKRNSFVPNDCKLDDADNRIMIITGPNMAGKSTFMRQNALIVFMAHLGSFVPAKSAHIGIVDRIFTRIGASDDLMYGQSTFMVEMVEVANILSSATDASLVLLDEVGRGTSTYDGLSIAWSVVDYLSTKLKAKTLFATHYHELTELEGKLDGVKNYRVIISEIAGELVFVRKVERGGAMRSFGIEVASLAGIPKVVIDRAKEILTKLEAGEKSQIDATGEDKVHTMLKQIDFNSLTPLKAMETLEYLINMVKE